tara:strand:- start:501 stop:695 length:195 start_codon:yes stop_codon:yes gene_type:complete
VNFEYNKGLNVKRKSRKPHPDHSAKYVPKGKDKILIDQDLIKRKEQLKREAISDHHDPRSQQEA